MLQPKIMSMLFIISTYFFSLLHFCLVLLFSIIFFSFFFCIISLFLASFIKVPYQNFSMDIAWKIMHGYFSINCFMSSAICSRSCTTFVSVFCCSLFFSCFSVSLHMIGVICYLQFYFDNCFNCSLYFNCLDKYKYFWPSQWVRWFSLEIELHEKKISNNTKQSSKDAKDSIN